MGTKQKPSPHDGYGKAMQDEPMFTMLARDPDAPSLIRQWAASRAEAVACGQRPPSDARLLLEAFALSIDMESWRRDNAGKWREPSPPAATDAAKPNAAPPNTTQPLDLAPFQVTAPAT